MKIGFKILLILMPNLIFGQINLIPPVDTAQIFSENFISTPNLEHSSPSINIDNNLICWSMWEKPKPEKPRQIIEIFNSVTDSIPKTIRFSNKYSDGGPTWINKNKILFYSKRPIDTTNPDKLTNDLWICEKTENGWNEPYCLKFSEYTRYAVSPSITNSGTIYFVGYFDNVENNMGIYCSNLGDNGCYEKPELLPSSINSRHLDWTPFIAADESYLIFSSNRPNSKDKYGDLYISFRENDNWSEPINLGDKVNTDKQERFPGVSKDLGILFFTRATDSNYDDIFWIDSKIIDEIKNE